MKVAVKDDPVKFAARSYGHALSALHGLPDRCAPSLGELADRIGADKLDLLTWVRADVEFARLIASKVTS
jgi:hypothetical protein